MSIDLIMTAITPGIALALAIYLADRYDKEPVKLLVKVFVGGALITIPIYYLEKLLQSFNIFSGIVSAAYTAFIVAGFSEEYFKRLIVILFAFKHSAFNEKLDGIVYAVFASLGFATVENIIYVVFRYSAEATIGFQRAIFSVPAHMLFAVTMGYYLSLAKYAPDEEKRKIYWRKSLISPILLHGAYNFILMSELQILIVLFIPFVIFLWVINLRKLNHFYTESRIAYKTKKKFFK